MAASAPRISVTTARRTRPAATSTTPTSTLPTSTSTRAGELAHELDPEFWWAADQARASQVFSLDDPEPIFTVTFPGPRTTTQNGIRSHHPDETYAFAHRDRDLTIHLTLEGQAAPGKVYIHCEDAAQLAEEWRKAGIDVAGPVGEDYGKREGSHVDPDGNLIRFGSQIRD